jgi:tRNA(Ile)-lysidine synthase TilS/MesJ
MELQDFSSILRGDSVPVILLDTLVEFWEYHPSFWFSHTPLTSWPTVHTTYKNTKAMNLSLLLQYDQIFRHPNPNIRPSWKPVAFRFATQMAFHILHTQWVDCKEWERVFVLLAIRHNASLELKEFVLRRTLLEAEATPTALWCRFLQATVWDVHCWKEKSGYSAEPVVDPCELRTFDGILESPRSHEEIAPIVELKARIRKVVGKEKKIAVSISGGVDSMLAAWAAHEVCKEDGKELLLLHVSYNNRACCEDECNLLRWYSQTLGVPLYIRKITEMQRVRVSGLRAVYEEVTRRIRFSFYRWFGCPVILGHNLEDCFENVFQNLSKQIHFENLFGMKEIGEEQGVSILRPFLNISKRLLVGFADNRGIPHLYDSTPTWSRRGQMRDLLIPGIQQFDLGILVGLKAFVERTQFLEDQWSKNMDRWCRELQCSEKVIQIPKDSFWESNQKGVQFWVRLFQNIGVSRPSNKSLANFIDMLERRQTGQCNLSGSIVATWTDEQICIMKS